MKNILIISFIYLISNLSYVNAQSYTFTDIHIKGSSILDNINYERTYKISKPDGNWCKNFIYTLKIPKFYDRTVLFNSLEVLLNSSAKKYTISYSSPYISATVDESTGTTYGNEYLIIQMQVNSESVGNEFTVKVGYKLKSHLNLTLFKPTDVYPLTTVPSGIKNTYTVYTSLIDSNDPIIVSKASEIIGNETSQGCIIQLLAEWIKGNIAYTDTLKESTHKASYVLQKRRGDCDAQSNLMIAFCRSLGIPARLVTGYSTRMQLRYPTEDSYITFCSGCNGTQASGYHAYYEVYYPSVGSWVAGDPAMSTLHFSHVTNLMEGQGKDINWTVEAKAYSISGSGQYDPNTETPPTRISLKSEDPIITILPSNLTSSFKYNYNNTFVGTINSLGKTLVNSSEWEDGIGIFDKVEIKDIGGIPNTKIIIPRTTTPNIFAAEFTSYYNDTWPIQWNWEIKLYHTGGVYSYLTQSFTTNSTTLAWTPTNLGNPPSNYDWLFDENGNIYGEVSVIVSLNDGDMKADKVPVGIVCKKEIENRIFTRSVTLEGCYINLQNATIQNKSNIIFKSPGNITIKAPFEVKPGSTFELRKP